MSIFSLVVAAKCDITLSTAKTASPPVETAADHAGARGPLARADARHLVVLGELAERRVKLFDRLAVGLEGALGGLLAGLQSQSEIAVGDYNQRTQSRSESR